MPAQPYSLCLEAPHRILGRAHSCVPRPARISLFLHPPSSRPAESARHRCFLHHTAVLRTPHLKGNVSSTAEILVALSTEGLHNPLLLHGGFPIIDGVVTSFNTIKMVQFDGMAVPWITTLCKATRTCDVARQIIAAADCAARHASHAVWGNDRSSCKHFQYIDGLGVPPLRLRLAVNGRTVAACLLSLPLLWGFLNKPGRRKRSGWDRV